MTEAGWTRKKPTVAGWYWWRGKEESGIALVFPADKPMPWHTSDHSARVQLFYSAGGMSSTRVNHFGGEWLGPIAPSTYHQGRVAGMREAAEIARNHKGGYTLDVFTAKLVTDPDGPWTLGSDIADAVEQAAQDEKGVGDGKV